jgi:hypothetical protein
MFALIALPVLCVVSVNWMVCFEDWALVYTFTGLNRRPLLGLIDMFVAFFTELCTFSEALISRRATAELTLE